MGRVIAIANQKGGVGKTTTAINLASCIADKEKKVLAIDMDPQGNMTSGFGIDKNELENTTYDLLVDDEFQVKDCMIENLFKQLSILPSNRNLAGAEIELLTVENMQYILRNKLEDVIDDYDFIIIDCPPALGMLTVNAMTAADTVIVPIQCEFFALDGLTQLIYTIGLIQNSLNPDLSIEGVVFTMYDARTNLSLQVVENVKDCLDQNIYKTIIPRNVKLAEAPSHGLPINLYAPKSAGAESYNLLADEVINNSEVSYDS
ncbi:MAG: AAA family ATPase [Lachnospiraceae bacterium]|nr:AAA family ATPase [Lachnospiraceae bacterium]